jgi:hypothetical protein
VRGEAAGRGGGNCVLADPNECPASPSAQGEGLPALPLGWGGDAAGSMIGWQGWPSQRGDRGSEVLTSQELAANCGPPV